MSIPVELADLRSKMADYTWAYLLTVRRDGTPHLVSLAPEWHDDSILLAVSAGTATNATAGTLVTLCFPPMDHDDYSLIVDGLATVVDAEGMLPDGKRRIRFAPTGAVLHRSALPGLSDSASGCIEDCLPVESPTTVSSASDVG